MPKFVDIYVLQKKIGSGQFGDVFKGYSKVDGTDVAIKTIKRDKVKGKFTELLQNQIQVLKSCKNNNIIQLIDIKKTVNNIYLVLQYCNQGDLGAYVKQKKKLHEDQAVEYLVQILHAFQTLVKSKIMHRDFKLPNVLKSDGVIKIADFGFAKLLGTEDQKVQTILGSPLNMAPEVLNHQPYNSKADIWSIGVAFYQMLFGKVPFSASNIVDLVKKIHKDPLSFPHSIPHEIEDVLRKMLVVDPGKRIDWVDLFKHPVVRFREDKLQEGLRKSLVCKNDQLSFNMSKFYIKANMVVQNTHQILQKVDFNNYVKNVMKNQKCQQYKGTTIKRQTERPKKQSNKELTLITNKEINEQEDFTEAEINIKELNQKIIKSNSNKLLHQRNSYAFLGHLAEQLLQINKNIYAQCLAFLLLKKIIGIIQKLKKDVSNRKYPGILKWDIYQKTVQYKSVNNFMESQQEIFSRFYEKLSLKVLTKGTLAQFQEDLMMSGKFTMEETNRIIYEKVMREYLRRVFESGKLNIVQWRHSSKLLDSLRMDALFLDNFDFQNYYDELNQAEEDIIKKKCLQKYAQFLKGKQVKQN